MVSTLLSLSLCISVSLSLRALVFEEAIRALRQPRMRPIWSGAQVLSKSLEDLRSMNSPVPEIEKGSSPNSDESAA